MRRAERIANDILSSERFAQTKAFKDHVYSDEPILRAGMSASVRPRNVQASSQQQRKDTASGAYTHRDARPATQHAQPARPAQPAQSQISLDSYFPELIAKPEPKREDRMPNRYKQMRALAHKRTSWDYTYGLGGNRLFYEQARFMEDFEDTYDFASGFSRYYPTYADMDNHDLRCYFGWRTRLKAWLRDKPQTEPPMAPASFVFVRVYEILCGVGTTPGMQGYADLDELRQAYAGISDTFDAHMRRWMHDYVIVHGLDSSLLPAGTSSPLFSAVYTLRHAEEALLRSAHGQKQISWPTAPLEGLPTSDELLEALIALSRYRADRSRFFKDNHDDVALVCSRVFARMVEHCSKRRKKGLVDGYFGEPCRRVYNMFSSAVYWSEEPQEEKTYDCGKAGSFICARGAWWREEPCRRMDTNAELGNLLHTIDARMRERSGDRHALKPRKLPKYQAKFVDEEVEAFYAQREAEEAARVRIDRSALAHIRSAAAVTREALLTDDERADVVVSEPVELVADKSEELAPRPEQSLPQEAAPQIEGLTAEQCALLRALVEGGPLPAGGGTFLSIAVDTINECFLDIVGDTVIEFDGENPVLVEDYVEEVREALA